jgi:ectoine hydroxylase-related dioxygenase (phytanoyl-CoA dioxygenase family)
MLETGGLVRNTATPTLHRWNTGFEWKDRTGPFRFLTDDQVRHFDELGFVVVPRLVDDELLEQVIAETDRFEAKTTAFLSGLDGERISIAENGAITFTAHLVARSPVLRALSQHRSLVDICADLVGDDVSMYWDQAVYKKPEKPRRFPWHQDNGYAFVEPQQYLTCWIALTDATVDNGCPHVAPRLHRQGTLAHTFVDPLGYECFSDPPEDVPAEVPAGGAVVFSSLTPHLTGPNVTADVRKAYILQYAPTGAEILSGDPAAGAATGRVAADEPDRQYPVLIGGQPAPVPAES